MADDIFNLKKLIILDDEPMMLRSLKRRFMTEGSGYEVKGFTDAKKALKELDKGGCFAFITDIMMPGITGDRVVEYIKEKKPTQACIVMTGHATRNNISRIAKAGNTIEVLAKPLVFERLLKALDKIVWQSRPVKEVYAIVYLDRIVIKIRQDNHVINKALYLALGVDLEGHKELLGLWLSENEDAKFGLKVLAELQDRGVKDILIASVDGLEDFPDAFNIAFPDTQIQLCIVNIVRNSVKHLPWKDYKTVTSDLKQIYQSGTKDEALHALEQLSDRWDDKYPQISRLWRMHWESLNTQFNYPQDIREVVCSTNAMESLNNVIRMEIKKQKSFPTDDSAIKAIYLAIHDASNEWTMPIMNWKAALNQFMIEFEDRLTDHI